MDTITERMNPSRASTAAAKGSSVVDENEQLKQLEFLLDDSVSSSVSSDSENTIFL